MEKGLENSDTTPPESPSLEALCSKVASLSKYCLPNQSTPPILEFPNSSNFPEQDTGITYNGVTFFKQYSQRPNNYIKIATPQINIEMYVNNFGKYFKAYTAQEGLKALFIWHASKRKAPAIYLVDKTHLLKIYTISSYELLTDVYQMIDGANKIAEREFQNGNLTLFAY